jgi:hemerythrin superfamily protein
MFAEIMQREQRMDIYQRICRDHETLRRLMTEFKDSAESDKARRAAIFGELQRELWAHGKVEETVFYAAIGESRQAKSETMEGFNEHHMINSLLDELQAMPPGDTAWNAKIQVLNEIVRHHIDEEEEELFEDARKVLKENQARELGQAFDERKRLAMAALEPLE